MTLEGVLMAVAVVGTLVAIAIITLVIAVIVYDTWGPWHMPSINLLKKKIMTGQAWAALSRDEQIEKADQKIDILQGVLDDVETVMAAQKDTLAEFGVDLHHLQPSGTLASMEYAVKQLKTERASNLADRLIESHLSPSQLKTYRKSNYFHAYGKQGNVYRITAAGDVSLVQPVKGEFCVYSTDRSQPGADVALGLKLLIEANEQEFLDTANWTGHYGGVYYSLIKFNPDGTPDPNRPYDPFADARRRPRRARDGGRLIPDALVDATTFGDTYRTYINATGTFTGTRNPGTRNPILNGPLNGVIGGTLYHGTTPIGILTGLDQDATGVVSGTFNARGGARLTGTFRQNNGVFDITYDGPMVGEG